MAQLNRMQRYGDNPKIPRNPTFEHFFRGGESSKWSPISSPTFGKDHDSEEDHSHHHKKSVLTKVKEKAKKLRHTLSKKKHSEGGNTTPSWGVTLDDEEQEEDAEYLGAPMYESELAPEGYKETARQRPRAVHVVSEKHVLASSVNRRAEQDKEKPTSPKKTITETVTETLTPAYAAVSDATHAIASKIQGLTVSAPAAPQTFSGEGAPQSGNSSTRDQIWDKGVSVKEYLMHKLEPGEDERTISQVISKAMSPRRTPGDIGVVEKVREAVTSLLRNEETPKYTAANSAKNSTSRTPIPTNAHSAKNSPSQLPISTNAHEAGEEENYGRILQAN